ncbi:hypothetical protein PVK06_017694 [Gossypium arboreum]|uniref:RNase H type-1 domain-containing protein n=1 Tax=Gossypium arboreum TaxID=29729 RepID=A0ABR0Q3Q2_GOSAR|nr:hypothetical protein PVK06_017694 [Gossypium arboreum]
MAACRATLDDYSLSALGFSGQWYTWERGRLTSNNIRERLNKGVANEEWLDWFPNFSVCHLQHSFSDHCPLVVDTIGRARGKGLNRKLMVEFKEEKIVMAVQSIAPLKASGEDGFPTLFYQKYWHIIGEEVTKYYLDVLHGRRNMEEINKTGAFIVGRQITDNIFVAYEILHSFKKRRGSSKKGFALKLDMSKAYDRIEWGFLENMIRRLGSGEDWIMLITRQILEEGMGWRVGNEESVNIWNDSWVPGSRSRRVHCQHIDIRYTTVSDLIDRDTTTWKQDTIRSLFGEEQLKSILSIPLISRNANGVEEVFRKPPKDDIIKINFDASFNPHTVNSVSGILGQNKEDLVMAACTFPWENISDPITAEERACLQSVTMVEEMGFQDIVVEGDALAIIRKLNSAEDDKSNISSLIKEIKGRPHRFRSLSFE